MFPSCFSRNSISLALPPSIPPALPPSLPLSLHRFLPPTHQSGGLHPVLVAPSQLLSLLLFAAACTAGAQASSCVNTPGGTYLGYSIPGNNDCGLIKGSVAMAFLAAFTYIGGFWYYALMSYYRR
ncbi:unnamed protein product [Closterium sp. NIES-53]